MITNRQNTAWGLRGASAILLLSLIHTSYAVATEPRPSKIAIAEGINLRFVAPTMKAGFRGDHKARVEPTAHHVQNADAQGGYARKPDLKFTHLTTNDGLSQDNVTDILQDRRGFMWFATGDGLNRYDGNTFVVYKNNRNDPGTLSDNFTRDLLEDDRGYLWVAAYPGINKFDPTSERFTRYVHDANNPNSIGGDSVESIALDSRGNLWLGTSENGLDKFDPASETFSHYSNDSDGRFVGRITHVIEDSHGDIWFVGERGLFHLNPVTGQITRPPAALPGLAADYVCEDNDGNFWMLAFSPIVGLIKYDRHAERFTNYPIGPAAAGQAGTRLLNDAGNGFWVPTSLGLYYFDRHTEHLTRLFQHDEANPNSLNDNSVVSIFRDRTGLLWVGTANGGLNILNLQQEQFGHYMHRQSDPNSLSPGKALALYQDSHGVLWVGFFPRALNRLDPATGRITHYVPDPNNGNGLSEGGDLNSIYRDVRGYLWLGGWAGGLERFDERTGQFKHYRYKPGDPGSLMNNNVLSIYGDRSGRLWVGEFGGVSVFDPATDRFINYRPDPSKTATLAYSVSAIYQDRSGTLWFGTLGGILSRFDDKTKTFMNNTPDLRDPHKLQGGSIGAIHEDRAGRLWLASGLGLYRYDRENEIFNRYTEGDGLPSHDVMGILEDAAGRLWISSKKGISRFDPQTETFRNYDVSDGLLSNEFSRSCYQQGRNGEMLFCGSNGMTAFFPENIQDNPFVPPVVITSFKLFNKPVPIGAKSVLKKAIPYADSLTLSYRDNVFSFEFAALSYANSQKNRYRYKLENFEPGWNEVGSKQRLATYTNLDPGRYIFRVQGSNSDGVWNEEGVSLPILITPPWWRTNLFRVLCGALFLVLLWAAYQLRARQLAYQFNMRLEERVAERTRVARDLHDTLLQSFQALLPLLQAGINMFGSRPADALRTFEKATDHASQAIAEGRDAIQGMRMSTVEKNDLAVAIRTVREELASAASNQPSPKFNVVVEGVSRNLHPILRDEVYRLSVEALRNAFRHAAAQNIEVEIRYDEKYFRLRVRDDGKGIPSDVLSGDGREGHYGLPGMRERAKLVGAELAIWSEVDSGTEVELSIPASRAYTKSIRRFWFLEKLSRKDTNAKEKIES